MALFMNVVQVKLKLFSLVFAGENGKFSGGFDIATLLEVQKTGKYL